MLLWEEVSIREVTGIYCAELLLDYNRICTHSQISNWKQVWASSGSRWVSWRWWVPGRLDDGIAKEERVGPEHVLHCDALLSSSELVSWTSPTMFLLVLHHCKAALSVPAKKFNLPVQILLVNSVDSWCCS